jgi:two-component system, response regulator PdtaR
MRRYLIVDDNRELAENLAEILRDRGSEVTVAASGPEALDMARERRFDALLTDMRMPFMGGAQVVRGIRRIDPGVAVVVVTAYEDDDALEAARREGLLAVLSKPVPVERLLRLLEAARRDGLVVVLEDDPHPADSLGEALRAHGFAAIGAASVLEAERLGPVRPFCALLDLRLPAGSDGEAVRRLAERFPGLPMLVVTGRADQVPPVACRGLFLTPLDTAALLEAVERLHVEAAGRA